MVIESHGEKLQLSEHVSFSGISIASRPELPDASLLSQSPYTLRGISIPSVQTAIVTPKLGPSLNQEVQSIPVRPPGPGEVVVKIAWTGICGSVSGLLGIQVSELLKQHIHRMFCSHSALKTASGDQIISLATKVSGT